MTTAAQLRLDPVYNPIRSLPGFAALLARAEADPRLSPTAKGKPAVDPSAAVDEKSVAVLAFANLSDDKENEYFSDGISEELLNVLAKVPGLKVTARTSAFYFKGKDLPMTDIARQLGVAYVVEGSVRKQGDRVRISAQLIKASDGFQVWSAQFDRELKDIFALQDEIAGLIAQQLSLKMGANSTRVPASVNPVAFELYVQARQALSRRDSDGFDRAEQLLTRVLELEPGLARAHAALADVWALRANLHEDIGYFGQRDAPIFARIEAEIGRALALDPDSAEAHASLGFVRYMEWRFADAERELRLAVTLNPNYPTGHHWLGTCLASSGLMDESLAEYERAAQLDPFSFRILENYGAVLHNAGRNEQALVVIDRSLELQPKSVQTLQVKLHTLLALERHAGAETVVRELPESDAKFYLAALGRRAEAEAALAKANDRDRADLLFSLGRFNEWFDRFKPSDFYVSGIKAILFSKGWDPVRQDPRFGKLIATLGLTEAHARAQAWRAAQPPDKPAAKP
jgi:TolB-like protein/Flp pilus assembly protein TadD